MNSGRELSNGIPSDAVDAARDEVRQAEHRLANDLERASEAGQATIKSALAKARPFLLGAAVAATLVCVAVLWRRPRRRAAWANEPRERSVLRDAGRAAAVSIASAIARRLGEHLLASPDLARPPLRSPLPQPLH